MSIPLSIQAFLIAKLKALNITKQNFISDSGIPDSVVYRLINGTQTNPSLYSVIKIANYFNCSIDEIVGRCDYLNNSQVKIFKHISLEGAAYSIKLYILDQLKQKNITANELAKIALIGTDTITKLIKTNSTKKSLSLKTIVAIADALQISIDEIIGR